MPNFSRAQIATLRARRSLENEPALNTLKLWLSEDVWEAREQREYWKQRAALFEAEFQRLRSLLRDLGHAEMAEAPSFYCVVPGCRRQAEDGSKVCASEERHPADANVQIQICFVRGCENERIHPLTPFCRSHKATYRAYAYGGSHDDLTPGEFMIGLEQGHFVHFDGEDPSPLPAPLRREGPPAPVPGLGLEVTTHGLPSHIETSNIEEALLRGTPSALDSSPVKCVYGQCSAPRAPEHALCSEHLSTL
jgi:hypothetical protein